MKKPEPKKLTEAKDGNAIVTLLKGYVPRDAQPDDLGVFEKVQAGEMIELPRMEAKALADADPPIAKVEII